MEATYAPSLVDRSGRRYRLDGAPWRGDDGSPLSMDPLRGAGPGDVDRADRTLWRYRRALPVESGRRVSLGEGGTPLVDVAWNGQRVLFKLEWFNPTASFKDRGVAVMMTHLAASGATAVLEDSSGNAGSSVAAYAAAAGMKATILVPASTSPDKTLQARAFGATVIPHRGNRDQVADAAAQKAEHSIYASHAWNPLFLQGVKTIGYEICEDLGWQAPDNIVTVAGGGSIALGCDLAFTEMLAASVIRRRPRIFIGQPGDWAPIARAIQGVVSPEAVHRRPTIAEGASIARPVRLPEVVEAVRRSGGGAVTVSDSEIARSTRQLMAAGLYAEPTSAVGAAALDRLLEQGVIRPDEQTVVVLTGTALKAPTIIRDVLAHGLSPSHRSAQAP